MTDSTATAVTPLRQAGIQICSMPEGGLAPCDLNVLRPVRFGLSGLRAPSSPDVSAVSSPTILNNVGLLLRTPSHPAGSRSARPAGVPSGRYPLRATDHPHNSRHFNRRLRRLPTAVELRRLRPLNGLCHRVCGQHSENDRDIGIQGRLTDTATRLGTD